MDAKGQGFGAGSPPGAAGLGKKFVSFLNTLWDRDISVSHWS